MKGKRLLYDTLAQAVKDRDCTLVDRATAMQIASVEASSLRAPAGLEDDEADLILVPANPLEDIHNLTNTRLVIHNGEVIRSN